MANKVATLEGGRELRAALKAAGVDLADLKQVNNRVARMVLVAATTDVPVRRGRLASSGRANNAVRQAVVTYSVPYANPIHWGWGRRHIKAQPWLLQAARDTEPRWVVLYHDGVQDILTRAEGQAA